MMKSVVVILAIIISTGHADRKLDFKYNPGCTSECSNLLKLAYVRAEGDNDTVHYLFDFTMKPSLVVVKSVKDSVITIDYEKLKTKGSDNTISFSKAPMYTFATVLNYLYEFNDINDTACLSNNSDIIGMDFKRFNNWNQTKLQNEGDFVQVTISASSYRSIGINKTGIVSVTLKVFGKEDKGLAFPHLVHTPESGEITLTLDHLKTANPKSRFAVELLTLSSYPYNYSEKITKKTFSDDSASGGVFSSILVNAIGEDFEEGGGYLTWKPVVFKAPDTHALNASSTAEYGIQSHSNTIDWINTPLFNLFGNELFNTQSYLMKATNVSFGETGDEFYLKSNYLYWTFLVGVGAPPNDSLGFFEVSIIASLLLLLTITMILVFCIFMRWISSKRNSIIYGQ